MRKYAQKCDVKRCKYFDGFFHKIANILDAQIFAVFPYMWMQNKKFNMKRSENLDFGSH